MNSKLKDEAIRVLDLEAKSILALKDLLSDGFYKAIDLILSCESKVIITGIGKSGLVGRKISSTLSSTGTPSMFLHPAESSHGDLGVVQNGDVVIAISKSGEASEMRAIINYTSKKGIPLIAITAKPESSLDKAANATLFIGNEKEACPLGLAPTTSTIATLAIGDAMAMCLLKARGFKESEFAEFHPGGALGRKLLTRVKDVMYTGNSLPLVDQNTSMLNVVTLMTGGEVKGVVGVIDSDGNLQGIVTDGDIRRSVLKGEQSLQMKVNEIMSKQPKTIDINELAAKAQFMMENFQIQSLFVIDKNSSKPNSPVGHVRIHDILKVM